MRKIFYLTILAVATIFVGCKSKTEETKVNYTAAELAKSYGTNEAVVSVNGLKTDVTSVIISGSDLNAMNMEIKDIESTNLVFSKVVFTNEDDCCSFADTKSYENNPEVKAELSGHVINGKLHITVSFNLKTEINGTYEHNQVSFKVGGNHFDLLPGQQIVIEGSEDKHIVSLPAGLIPGEGAMKIEVVCNPDENHTLFFGTHKTTDCDYMFVGSVESSGILLFEVLPTYNSKIVGTWNFPIPVFDEYGDDQSGDKVLRFDIATQDGKGYYFGMEMPVEDCGEYYSALGAMLRGYVPFDPNNESELTYVGCLRNITFKEDGNLIAEYNTNFDPMAQPQKPPVWVESPVGGMKWYTKGDQIFLVPNLNLMTKAGISTDGIALGIKSYETNYGKTYTQIYLPTEMCVPMVSLLSTVIGVVPDELNEFIPMAKTIVGDLGKMAAKATKFEIGINLEKGSIQ